MALISPIVNVLSSTAHLSEDESVQLLAEVLHHIVTLRFTMHEEVEAGLLLEFNRVLDLSLHRLLVPAQVSETSNQVIHSLFFGDLTLVEPCTSLSDLLGLRDGSDGSGGEFGKLEV